MCEQNHLSIGCKVILEREMELHPVSLICRRSGFSMRLSAFDSGSSMKKPIDIREKSIESEKENKANQMQMIRVGDANDQRRLELDRPKGHPKRMS
jgi:hypothetical protein